MPLTVVTTDTNGDFSDSFDLRSVIAVGETTGTVTVPHTDDSYWEADRTYTARIEAGGAPFIETGDTVSYVVQDNDLPEVILREYMSRQDYLSLPEYCWGQYIDTATGLPVVKPPPPWLIPLTPGVTLDDYLRELREFHSAVTVFVDPCWIARFIDEGDSPELVARLTNAPAGAPETVTVNLNADISGTIVPRVAYYKTPLHILYADPSRYDPSYTLLDSSEYTLPASVTIAQGATQANVHG